MDRVAKFKKFRNPIEIELENRQDCIDDCTNADKEFALTWEDIDEIMQIEDYLNRYTKIPLEGRIAFCGEVLRRFKESKQIASNGTREEKGR